MEAVITVHLFTLCRLIGNGDEGIRIKIRILFQESLGTQIAVRVEGSVLVAVFKVKALGRLAEDDALGTVNLGEHFLSSFIRILSFPDHLSQFAHILADQGIEHLHEGGGMGGLIGFGHHPLGHSAVFADDIGSHIPIAAVMETVQNIFHHSVIQTVIGMFHGQIKHVVCLFQLVIECGVVFRKLEVLDAALCTDLLTDDIERREHPASAALLLGGDGGCLYLNGKVPVQPCRVQRQENKVLDFRAGTGGLRVFRIFVLVEFIAEFFQ